QRLLDARAEAWREPGTGALERALARGSPAMAHDRAALEEAVGLGVTYPGLAFTVAGAEVVRDRPGRRVVTAQVSRAAYRITGGPAGAGGITEPAQAHDVCVVLTSGPGGWRIHDWRPTGDDS
ncbi:hypothetical protein, partial [Ornithinicoccus halotolerans]|uniref:hypothetical protein n=1 Tax=Ornithinicoccus halotolerans TaxID=1748220 RepID=UPI001885E9C0